MILIYICLYRTLKLYRVKLQTNFKILAAGLGQTNRLINYNKINYIILNRPKHDVSTFIISINSYQIFEKMI